MAMMEAYFDESGAHDGAKHLCLSGYLFEKERRQQLDAEWKVMLESWDIDHFHMTDCAPDPGWGVFAGWNKKDRIKVATDAIEIIKRHHTLGIAVTIELEYANLVPRYGQNINDYSLLCWQALLAVRHWADSHKYKGDMAYFFETGHSSQVQASRIMHEIFRDPYLNKQYRFAAHAFVEKKSSYPVQCADILAWQCHNQLVRNEKGIKHLRADMKSLVERDHVINMFDKNGIDEWLTRVNYSRHLTDLKLKLGLKPTIEEMMLRDPAKFPRTYKFLAKLTGSMTIILPLNHSSSFHLICQPQLYEKLAA